jgi:ribosomal protein S26
MRYTSNKLFCVNCGKESIPISRKNAKLHGKFHRKKMYCPWCKTTLNHVEIRSDEEKEEFLTMFQEGQFKEEAKKSIEFCKKGDVLL